MGAVPASEEVESTLRDTPMRFWISSCESPFDSRKAIFLSVGASCMEGSSRNLEACSCIVLLDEAVDETDGGSLDGSSCRCH